MYLSFVLPYGQRLINILALTSMKENSSTQGCNGKVYLITYEGKVNIKIFLVFLNCSEIKTCR